MSTTFDLRRRAPRRVRGSVASAQLRAGLAMFAGVQLALAAFMAIAPHTFFTAIGPFGAGNDHYVRDVSSFYAAIGIALAVSVRRSSWRVPVLAVTTVQFALHTLNHLLDLESAHPAWTGWLDFLALLAATIQLAVLWRIANRAARGGPGEAPLPDSRSLGGTG